MRGYQPPPLTDDDIEKGCERLMHLLTNESEHSNFQFDKIEEILKKNGILTQSISVFSVEHLRNLIKKPLDRDQLVLVINVCANFYQDKKDPRGMGRMQFFAGLEPSSINASFFSYLRNVEITWDRIKLNMFEYVNNQFEKIAEETIKIMKSKQKDNQTLSEVGAQLKKLRTEVESLEMKNIIDRDELKKLVLAHGNEAVKNLIPQMPFSKFNVPSITSPVSTISTDFFDNSPPGSKISTRPPSPTEEKGDLEPKSPK